MGFRFRKSFKLAPGVRVTVGKRGVSTSIGVKGARITKRADGRVQTTFSAPGTGLSYTTVSPGKRKRSSPRSNRASMAYDTGGPVRPGNPGFLPYLFNFFLPGSAFFFIREWKLAIVWMTAMMLTILLARPLVSLMYIATFVHFYFAARGGFSSAPRLQAAERWVRQKWGWLAGGFFIATLALSSNQAGTVAEQKSVQQEALVDSAALTQSAAEPTAAGVEANQAVAPEPPAQPDSVTPEEAETDPAPTPADPEAPDAADLFALGSTPETLTSLEYSVEGDRQYYTWDRPDLGREVKTVYLAPDDWWVKISDPTFQASELGDLESVTDQVGRYTSGPLAGALVIQNSAIHLWSQKYYDRDHAPVQEPEPVAESEAEPASEAPVVTEEPAEVQPAYDAPAEQLFFANCSEAKAAGYSNIKKGDPAYSPKLDRDKDGVACERK